MSQEQGFTKLESSTLLAPSAEHLFIYNKCFHLVLIQSCPEVGMRITNLLVRENQEFNRFGPGQTGIQLDLISSPSFFDTGFYYVAPDGLELYL